MTVHIPFEPVMILAGSNPVAKKWARENGWPNAAWRYHGDARYMDGIRLRHVHGLIVLPSFWNKRGCSAMWEMLRIAASMGNVWVPEYAEANGHSGYVLTRFARDQPTTS